MASPSEGESSGARPPGVRHELPRLSWWPLGIAASLVAVLLWLADRYGPHRDELYFVAAGHHPSWGYPDQPPITPLIAALSDSLAHRNLTLLRLTSALAVGAVVVLSGCTARLLGGGRAAQVLTSVVVATGVFTAAIGHLLSTASLDYAFWTLIIFLAMRALSADDARWWLVVGVTTGAGLENKDLVLFLAIALLAGIALVAETRHHLRSPLLWVGALVAVLLWLPNLVWQAVHGWPQLALSADINDEYSTVSERVFYVLLQVLLFSPLGSAVWIIGLVVLLRRAEWAWARPVAVAYVVLFVFFAISGGKGYYLAGAFPALIAAGAVVLERAWSGRRLLAAGLALAAAGLVAWPAAVPVLPPHTLAASPYGALAEDQLETVGWPAFAATIRHVVVTIPPPQRARTVVFTGNYGEAGALEWYDVSSRVYSGHNGFGAWGPPPEGASPVVVVGYDDPSRDFRGCRRVATIDNGADVDNEEQGGPVWRCRAPVGGWASAWTRLTHLDG